MTLRELLPILESLPDGATVFAERIDGEFRPESEFILHELTETELGTPVHEVAQRHAPGKEYFLEVFVIKEVIEGWEGMYDLSEPHVPSMLDAVIYYAENDAWPHVEDPDE